MMKRNTLLAAMSSAVLIAAFDNPVDKKPGWKLDADGKIAVDGDGHPIYVNTAGEEQTVRGDRISTLNAEAKAHRERADAAEKALKAFEGIDAAEARKAIDTASKLTEKQLIDAGEAERVRTEIENRYKEQLEAASTRAAELEQSNNDLRLDRLFGGSKYVSDNVIVPEDMLRSSLATRLKIEEGRVYGLDAKGEKLLSAKNAGEYAEGDEIIELLVKSHPQKDRILKSTAVTGTGEKPGGGNRPTNGKVMKRADFDALSPQEQAKYGKEAATGALSIVD